MVDKWCSSPWRRYNFSSKRRALGCVTVHFIESSDLIMYYFNNLEFNLLLSKLWVLIWTNHKLKNLKWIFYIKNWYEGHYKNFNITRTHGWKKIYISNVGQAKMSKAPTGLALGLEAKNAPTVFLPIFKILIIFLDYFTI